MKFAVVASTLLLAGSAIAAPGTAMRRKRNAERKHKTMIPSNGPSDAITNNTNVQYSGNWGGAVLVGNGYTGVVGTFKAPTPSTTGSGSAWVGIDGDTCGSAILQTGIDWTRSSSGKVTYDAWYEWYPDYEYNFSGITINPGDTIKTTVKSTGTYSGIATVQNVSTGKTVTHTFTSQTEGALCNENAEWIVEDYESGSSQVKFANYGTVTFTGISATQNGNTVSASGAQIIDMEDSNGNVLSSCSATSSSVTCKYQ